MAWMRLVRPTRAVTGVVVIPRLCGTREFEKKKSLLATRRRCRGRAVLHGAAVATPLYIVQQCRYGYSCLWPTAVAAWTWAWARVCQRAVAATFSPKLRGARRTACSSTLLRLLVTATALPSPPRLNSRDSCLRAACVWAACLPRRPRVTFSYLQ